MSSQIPTFARIEEDTRDVSNKKSIIFNFYGFFYIYQRLFLSLLL